MLTERRQKLLQFIIDEYVTTAQPVGSGALVEKYRLPVSSATIRNEMAQLEEEGYIHVDRSKKPFEYSIDWTKPWPYVPWLQVAAFHPVVRDALKGLSEGAIRAYQQALREGADPSTRLREIFVTEPDKVGVR